MPNEEGNSKTNSIQNKFPNQGNFSASKNNMSNDSSNLRNVVNNSRLNNNTSLQNNQTNNSNQIDDAKKEIAKKGLEAAATAAGGKAGGELTKAALNSKFGNKVLNSANNLTKSPIRRMFDSINKKSELSDDENDENNNVASSENIEEETQDSSGGNSLVPKEITSKIKPFAIVSSFGCLGSIFIVVIVAAVMLSPIFFIGDLLNSVKEGVSNVWSGIVAFFKGCSDEFECQQKEKDSFYEKLLEVHNEYQEEYNVTLNTELITATLTYYSPSALEEIEDIDNLVPSNMIDFKKSEKKIRDLADAMLGKGMICKDSQGNVLAELKEETECPKPSQETYYDEKLQKEMPNLVVSEESYYIDDDKYKEYLEEFIRKFYFDNKSGEEIDKQIPMIIDDIYSRVELVKYLNSSSNSSSNFVANNSQVIIMDCTGTIELETVSLYEYLQGVLYIEGFAERRSEEFLKMHAVAAKTYLYAKNKATPDSIPSTLKIRNCQMNQLYCDIEEGCHSLGDGADNSHNTIATGADINGNYHLPPITKVETLEKIKRAIDATLSEFIIQDGKFITTQYRSDCVALGKICDSTTNILDQKVANQMINEGKNYKEVLNYFYSGEIQEIFMNSYGYPLDLIYNRITSPFGMRVHPTLHYCKYHGGIDLGAPAEANIYALADGVVTENYYSSSYGNVTIVGHGNNVNGKYEYYSLYAHQIRLSNLISIGSSVKSGQVIGNVGSTGRSTGNHLHMEIYSFDDKNKKIKLNPQEYFKGVEFTGRTEGALYNSCDECLVDAPIKKCD